MECSICGQKIESNSNQKVCDTCLQDNIPNMCVSGCGNIRPTRTKGYCSPECREVLKDPSFRNYYIVTFFHEEPDTQRLQLFSNWWNRYINAENTDENKKEFSVTMVLEIIKEMKTRTTHEKNIFLIAVAENMKEAENMNNSTHDKLRHTLKLKLSKLFKADGKRRSKRLIEEKLKKNSSDSSSDEEMDNTKGKNGGKRKTKRRRKKRRTKKKKRIKKRRKRKTRRKRK